MDSNQKLEIRTSISIFMLCIQLWLQSKDPSVWKGINSHRGKFRSQLLTVPSENHFLRKCVVYGRSLVKCYRFSTNLKVYRLGRRGAHTITNSCREGSVFGAVVLLEDRRLFYA